MDKKGYILVVDQSGERGIIRVPSPELENGAPEVFVELDNGRAVAVPASMMTQVAEKGFRLKGTFAELEQRSQSVSQGANGHSQSADSVVMPVMQEELDVQRQEIETGRVRIHKTVHEHTEVVDEPLIEEDVHVERVPVNTPVYGPVPVRYEGDTVIVPLLEEVIVVEKRLVLKEELHITRRQHERHKPQEVTLRKEEATVERLDAAENDAVKQEGEQSRSAASSK